MDLSLKIIYGFVLVLLLALSAIFSASETAYASLNPGKIETMIDNKEFGAKIIKKQYHFFNQTLSTILICNNIVNVASSALTSYLLSIWLGSQFANYNVLISTAIMTPIIVIFGEIVPKLIAKAEPILVAKSFCYILQSLYFIFWPVTFPISKIGKKIYITNSEEDVKNLIDVAQNEGVLETNESIMAQNALDLDSTKVQKHYIRLKDVTWIDASSNIEEALEKFKSTNYSRLPVKKDEQFIGILHLKDIFFLQRGRIINYFKTVPMISANSSLSTAMEKMRLQRAQMAFVTKNNNSSEVLGIITIEDIVEEIVGEIYDEFDEEEIADIFEISLDLFHVSGHVKMKEIIKQMNLELEISDEEKEQKVSDWLKLKIGSSLTKSAKYTLNDVHFKVLWLPDKKNKDYRIEIELGNQAEIQSESNETIV